MPGIWSTTPSAAAWWRGFRVSLGARGPEVKVEGDGLPPGLASCLASAVHRLGLPAPDAWPGDFSTQVTFYPQQ